MLAQAPNPRPSPLPLPSALLAAELAPVVMADDPCEAAFEGGDPTGPRKYYRARYYDPKIGRFLSEDPLRWREGPNFYPYVRNNPVNLIDPWGWCACTSSSNSCCEEIRRRKQRIHGFLDVLEGKPSSPSAGVGDIGGATTCSGHQPDIDYDMIRRTTSPCLLKCAIQHEERHATQCRRFGAAFLGWNVTTSERSAYMQELGCLIRQEREQQCCN